MLYLPRSSVPLGIDGRGGADNGHGEFRPLLRATLVEQADLDRAIERCRANRAAGVPPIAALIGASYEEER